MSAGSCCTRIRAIDDQGNDAIRWQRRTSQSTKLSFLDIMDDRFSPTSAPVGKYCNHAA